jgi:hypothetical protein
MKKIIILLAVILFPLSVMAVDPPYMMTTYSEEVLSVSSNVVTFTAGKIAASSTYDGIANARQAYCCVETASIRISFLTNPSATSGLPIASGTCFNVLSVTEVAAVKMIAQSGTAKVTCEYSK